MATAEKTYRYEEVNGTMTASNVQTNNEARYDLDRHRKNGLGADVKDRVECTSMGYFFLHNQLVID